MRRLAASLALPLVLWLPGAPTPGTGGHPLPFAVPGTAGGDREVEREEGGLGPGPGTAWATARTFPLGPDPPRRLRPRARPAAGPAPPAREDAGPRAAAVDRLVGPAPLDTSVGSLGDEQRP